MCIAIGQPKGTPTLTIEELERGWEANPDGGGFAYIKGDRVLSVRSMDKDEFILKYIEAHEEYGKSSPFMVHMRIATHGSVTLSNTHPFRVGLHGKGDMMFIHNGIISKLDPEVKDLDITDTQALATFVLTDMADSWLDNIYLTEYIEDFIDYSKLVFLTTSPALASNLYILNEASGIWGESGVWYSNYSCFIVTKAKRTPRSRQYNYDMWDDGWGCGTDGVSYYHNGVEQHWGGGQFEAIDTFESWLIDPDERRYNAWDLTNATPADHVEMLNECITQGDACAICTGKARCLCDDTCDVCYEFYHECECHGPFLSMADGNGEDGTRLGAISSHHLVSAVLAEQELASPF